MIVVKHQITAYIIYVTICAAYTTIMLKVGSGRTAVACGKFIEHNAAFVRKGKLEMSGKIHPEGEGQ